MIPETFAEVGSTGNVGLFPFAKGAERFDEFELRKHSQQNFFDFDLSVLGEYSRNEQTNVTFGSLVVAQFRQNPKESAFRIVEFCVNDFVPNASDL